MRTLNVSFPAAPSGHHLKAQVAPDSMLNVHHVIAYREIAEELAAAAAELDAVDRAEVAGPGFVNVFLRDEWFVSAR